MGFLVLAVLCSVAVSVFFRLSREFHLENHQTVTWNYLTCASLAFGLLHPPLDALRAKHAPWGWWSLLGVLLPVLFLVLASSVQRAGVVRTEIAQRLSLVLSLTAAFTLFGDQASSRQWAGLALGVVAIPCLLMRPRVGHKRHSTDWHLPLLVLVGWAASDVLLKRIALDGAPLSVSLFVTFAIAFVPMLMWQLWRHFRGASRLRLRNVIGGVLLGVLNFANIGFYLAAHRAMAKTPSIVFAGMNIGVVVLGTLVGVFVFRERLGKLNVLAIALAVVALFLLNVTG